MASQQCIRPIHLDCVPIYSLLMDQLLHGWLPNWPQVFHWSGQYYKHFYRDGEWGSGGRATKLLTNPMSKVKTARLHQLLPLLAPHITQSS